jgi:formylglycine-generating enzyme required for sulfatase activity
LRVSESIGQKPWTSHGPLPAVYFAGRGVHPPIAGNPTPEKPLLTPEKPLETQHAIAVPPAPPVPPEPSCDGQPVAVSTGFKPCIKPGSGESFRDCPDCPEMVVVPAGAFTMGSPEEEEEGRHADEGPQHSVTIAKPFAVGKFTVTFEEWDRCVSGGGCTSNPHPSDHGWGRGKHPVVDVSWSDANEYTIWLAIKTGKVYRLPSEAEWEYAARAGTTTRYYWGDRIGVDRANCNRCGKHGGKTTPVGFFSANPFGLYDMHGNVWQWVQDCYRNSYVGAPADGAARIGNCDAHVLRGGAWDDLPLDLRSAYRRGYPVDNVATWRGLRVAREL